MNQASRRMALSTMALAETIRELGSAPLGPMYAAAMGSMSLEEFDACIATLVRAKLVKKAGHVATWIGPTLNPLPSGDQQMSKQTPTGKAGKAEKAGKKTGQTTNSPATTKKEVDSASASVVGSSNVSTEQAVQQAPGTNNSIRQEQKNMTVTLKGISKNKRRAIYSSGAATFHVTLSSLVDPAKPPQSFEVSDGVFKAAATPKAKMTPEQRKAARAAAPKLTLTEKIAKREEALQKLRDKAAKEAAAKTAPAAGAPAASGTPSA